MGIAQQLFVELLTLIKYISFAIVVMGRKPKCRKPDKRLLFVLAAVGVYAVFLFAGSDRTIVFLVFQLVIVSVFYALCCAWYC